MLGQFTTVLLIWKDISHPRSACEVEITCVLFLTLKSQIHRHLLHGCPSIVRIAYLANEHMYVAVHNFYWIIEHKIHRVYGNSLLGM